jgi:hypothetical protein
MLKVHRRRTICFLDSDFVWLAVGIFRITLTVQKLFDFFDYHWKCALKILGRDSPKEKMFFSMTPQKGISLRQSARNEVSHASALAQGNVVQAMEAFNGQGYFSRVRRLKSPRPINTKV